MATQVGWHTHTDTACLVSVHSQTNELCTIMFTVFPVQDKEGSIPHDDLGKSIATVQVLQRKHETFEREVTALGNKVYRIYSHSSVFIGLRIYVWQDTIHLSMTRANKLAT